MVKLAFPWSVCRSRWQPSTIIASRDNYHCTRSADFATIRIRSGRRIGGLTRVFLAPASPWRGMTMLQTAQVLPNILAVEDHPSLAQSVLPTPAAAGLALGTSARTLPLPSPDPRLPHTRSQRTLSRQSADVLPKKNHLPSSWRKVVLRFTNRRLAGGSAQVHV